uniref:Uncharacterized protein n=1 Tax=Pavo cristatus TaxID=9049 RepID=A0A8C9FN95_PAVCR
MSHCSQDSFRESSRSEEDAISGEHEIQIEGVRTELEAIELEDGAAVPKEFANPTDGGVCGNDVQLHPLGKHFRSVREKNRAKDQRVMDSLLWDPQWFCTDI